MEPDIGVQDSLGHACLFGEPVEDRSGNLVEAFSYVRCSSREINTLEYPVLYCCCSSVSSLIEILKAESTNPQLLKNMRTASAKPKVDYFIDYLLYHIGVSFSKITNATPHKNGTRGSVEFTGMLTAVISGPTTFACNVTSGTVVMWLDDHILCGSDSLFPSSSTLEPLSFFLPSVLFLPELHWLAMLMSASNFLLHAAV